MSDLSTQSCDACRADAPRVTDEELTELMKQVSEWSLITVDGILQLQREYAFKDFKQSIAFTNAVGDYAEQEGHHPALLTEWGKTTVTWWTHKIKGLHKNDFIMAAKTDKLFEAV